MRIVEIAALLTMLLITGGRCRPDVGRDYMAEDYNNVDDDTAETDNPGLPEPDSPPPHIHTSSLKLLVRLGQDVQLPCNATNTQDVAVTWMRGTTPLYYDDLPADRDDRRITRRNDNSLIIHNFMENDVSDEYKCEISSTPPEMVVHSVRTSRHVFVLPSKTIEVSGSNQNVKLACQANWEPKPKIEWYFKGKKVASDEHPADGSSLTIYNVSESSAGGYQCLVESTLDPKPTLYPIHVLLHHAPRIEAGNEIVHSGLHMESELTCVVDAYPQAQVIWLKDGNRVTTGKMIRTELSQENMKHVLVFNQTGKHDFGKYVCEAMNSEGKSKRLIELTGAPRAPKFIGVQANADSNITTLEWQVESYSPIIKYELKYRRKGEKNWQSASPRASDDGTSNVFKIKYDLQGLKEGEYEAVLLAQNEFGWSSEPEQPQIFSGAGSKSGAASVQSLLLSRSLLVAASLLVYTTCL